VRAAASPGPKFLVPVVSHPHTGHRFTRRLKSANKINARVRKTKKNGTCMSYMMNVITSDPVKRMKPDFQDPIVFTGS